MVFSFQNAITAVGGAAVTRGTGSVSSVTFNGTEVFVNLTGVTNAQSITVTVTGLVGASPGGATSVEGVMGVLIGDTNNDRTVNSGDAQQTRNRSGEVADGTTFRSDVNADGTVNSGDAILVRSHSGTGL
jgi:hypothetical protein